MNNRCYLISWRVSCVSRCHLYLRCLLCSPHRKLDKRCVVFHVDVAICIEGVSLTRIGSQILNDEINHQCFFDVLLEGCSGINTWA